MALGTNLLCKIFDHLAENDSKQRLIRRLYCESGQPAKKAHGFVKKGTQEKLDKIIPKCKDCKKKLQSRTMVMILEELTKNSEYELLKEFYRALEGPGKKAYKLANSQTQDALGAM